MDTSISVAELLSDIGSGEPTPGGGATGAFIVAVGARQASMIINIALKNKKCTAKPKNIEALNTAKENLDSIVKSALDEWSHDTEAYKEVCRAQALPRVTEQDIQLRTEEMQTALIKATVPGLYTLQLVCQALEALRIIFDICPISLDSDVACSAAQLEAGAECAWATILANVKYIKDDNNRKYIRRQGERDIAIIRYISEAFISRNERETK